jgi:hypothetical protein
LCLIITQEQFGSKKKKEEEEGAELRLFSQTYPAISLFLPLREKQEEHPGVPGSKPAPGKWFMRCYLKP